MMKTRLCAAALVFFTLGAGLFAQAAQDTAAVTLTLEQVVARAETNQPLILQAQAAVEAARARVGQAQSTYFPSVSASGMYTLLEPDQTIPGFGSLVPVNNWDFNVGLRQVIFQFGRRGVQVKLAENGVSAARIGVDQIRSSIAYQAAQGFYTVLFLQGEIKALNEQLRNLQEHLRGTQIKEQTGSATRYDVLGTGVRISVQQSQLIDAESQYQKQLIALRQLLGMDESANFGLSGGFTPDRSEERRVGKECDR
jgi:outer membrane protein